MTSCIFCQIVAGTAKAEIVYQDELVTAFRDIHPAAPIHLLIVPNRHIESVNFVGAEEEATAGRLFGVARQLAAERGIASDGYRLVVNTNHHGGQTVFHLHLHLLGGRSLRAMG